MRQIPETSPKTAAERLARDERLSRALRDNLRRRKEQARARAERGAGLPDPEASQAPGSASDKTV